MDGIELRISADLATLLVAGKPTVSVQVERMIDEIARRCGGAAIAPACGILPTGVRLWLERGDATAVAIEVPPHARRVRWLKEDSLLPFGKRAGYADYYLSFPYIVILVVFSEGAITGIQQLYYRTESLDRGEMLLLPNLLNVAEAYDLQCWVCLQNLRDVSTLSWPERVAAVVDHVFTAAFNRSAEMHEGNSYFNAMRDLDARIGSVSAWETATRKNPRFALDVAWRDAHTTVTAEMLAMLDEVAPSSQMTTAADLAPLLMRAKRRKAEP